MAPVMVTKIKGATLIEVIVAMVIVMTVFGISMMIYLHVLNSSMSERQVRIGLLLKRVGEDTISSKRFFDETFDEEGFSIRKSIAKYDNRDNLIHLHLEIVDGGKIFSRDQLILHEINEED
jgi:hypothetical protein